MRKILPLLWILGLLSACGDDDPAAPDAGNIPDQCLGDADVAILGPYYADGGGVNSEVVDVLYMCGQSVCSDELLGPDPVAAQTCMHDCYSTSIIAGLSAGCEGCWTQSVQCAADNCAVICLGMDQQACVDCVSETCNPQTNYCTGI